VDSFVESLKKHAREVPADVRAAATAQTLAFGLLADLAHRPAEAPDRAALLPPLPPASGAAVGMADDATGAGEVSLIGEMPNPVRNQNPRSTCIPHGVLVTFEHYLKKVSGDTYDLSEQFLWWACKQLDGQPREWRGTTMTAAEAALARFGVCQEADWEYVPTDDHVNVSQGPPKDGAQDAALAFKTPVKRVAATLAAEFKQVVDSGRCAAFAVDVFSSFLSPTVRSTGKILMPAPGEQRIGGHCMCIVGYRDDPAPGLGGGRFILRNSFGEEWGAASPFGYPKGYGTIPYAYVAQYGREFGITFE
jgi:C1A family cysteine protease